MAMCQAGRSENTWYDSEFFIYIYIYISPDATPAANTRRLRGTPIRTQHCDSFIHHWFYFLPFPKDEAHNWPKRDTLRESESLPTWLVKGKTCPLLAWRGARDIYPGKDFLCLFIYILQSPFSLGGGVQQREERRWSRCNRMYPWWDKKFGGIDHCGHAQHEESLCHPSRIYPANWKQGQGSWQGLCSTVRVKNSYIYIFLFRTTNETVNNMGSKAPPP